jgi:hypothetical protein
MMGNQIEFAPLLPMPFLLLLIVIAALYIGICIFRRLSGWPYRALACIAVLAALLGPVIKEEVRDPLSNVVFLVLDESESQTVSDRATQVSEALKNLENALGRIDNLDTRFLRVTTEAGNRDAGSLILTALSEAANEVASNRIAGAIILTDGRIHDADILAGFPAPVHVMLTGKDTDWDRRLIVQKTPAFAIVDEEIILSLRIEDQGVVPENVKGNAIIQISIDGEAPSEFTVLTDEDLELPITLRHGGMNVLQFTVLSPDGELTDRNNSAIVSINGVRDRLRVLLVSGEPHAGERTWRNLLKSDSAVDLVHFTILRSPDKMDGVPVNELSLIAFPTRELFVEKIDEFDLIIFDRYRKRGILPSLYLENVADYVRSGGAVLIAAGDAFGSVESLYRSPLRAILPAEPTSIVLEEGFTPLVTDIGNRHPVTESLIDFAPRLPAEDGTPGWGRWFRLIDSVPRSGNVVMTGPDDRPLLILDRVEEGRIAMLMSDHAWLWSRGFEGGGPQLELLRRLAHWSMKEPDLEEERLFATSDGVEVTVTRRSINEEPQSVIVEYPDGSSKELDLTAIAPGSWQSTFEGRENGLYRLSDGVITSVVAIGPTAPKEFEQTIADATALTPLVKATKGGILRIETISAPNIRLAKEGRVASGRNWFGITMRDAYVVKDLRQTPMLPAWVWMMLAGLLTVAAWIREGR